MTKFSEEIPRNQQLSDDWTCEAAAQGFQTALDNVKKANLKSN